MVPLVDVSVFASVNEFSVLISVTCAEVLSIELEVVAMVPLVEVSAFCSVDDFSILIWVLIELD